MSIDTGISDGEIVNALRSGKLTPSMVGLRQFEIRYYAATDSAPTTLDDDDESCDMVSVLWNDGGRVGAFCHCEHATSDIPGDTIEGVGGEYAWYFDGGGYYPTFSYVTDDKELCEAIRGILDAGQ